MNWIILSDIHSNLEALESFFEAVHIVLNGESRFICLGDIVGYGADPETCINRIKENNIQAIAGNHERMLINVDERAKANHLAVHAIELESKMLTFEAIEYIRSLPPELNIDKTYLAVHGSPDDPDEYVANRSSAVRAIYALDEKEISICFHGHSHIPGIFENNGLYYYQENTRFVLPDEGRYLINPGSIGQPRDGDPRGSFCVYNDTDRSVEFYRFQYPIEQTVRKMLSAGIPHELADRLHCGR